MYRIVHYKTGYCLDVAGYRNQANDLPITLFPCAVADDHLWSLYYQ
jgi:hypothetical protein